MSIDERAEVSFESRRAFLARRLIIAVATPLVLAIVLGAILGRQLLAISADAEAADRSAEVLGLAHQALLQIVDQETGMRGYLLTRDREFLQPYERSSPPAVFARIHALTADSPRQRASFDEALRRYRLWLDAVRPALSPGAVESASSAVSMRLRKSRMDAVRESMREGITIAEDQHRHRVMLSAASTSTTRALFAVLLLAAAAVLAIVSRRQLGSVGAMFGDALAAETKARHEVEAEAWIRAGYAKLTTALQGDQTLQQLGTDCLRVLAEHTHADVGAFFTKDDGAWQRQAGYSLDSRAAGPDRFAEGEGIVGRVGAGCEPASLRDVAPDYLKLRSGTGEVSPVELVVVPACIGGTANAVMELAFHTAADPRSIELLGRIGESVAIAVRSCEDRERSRVYLEKTQRQAEELQTQQEELRLQNEELEQQSRVLTEAKSRLESHQTELEQINAKLQEQTDTLALQRDDFARSQRDLQRANHYKSEFLANMSHELRTPLNSSLILSKLLLDNRDGNLTREQVKFAQTIYSSGNDLLTLINDILDLSKVEAGKLDVRSERVLIRPLVAELANTFNPMARERGLELRMEVDDRVPAAIQTDSTRLQQILKNLLSNALKFTERGSVSLRVLSARHSGAQRSEDDANTPRVNLKDSQAPSADPGNVAFEVRDTGIGIPVEQHDVIFEAFRHADGTTHRKYGGTGLGLSISRELAHLLGGTITLESAPTEGSTFRLLMPERPVSPAQQTAAPLRPPSSPTYPAVNRRRAARPSPPTPAVPDDREHLAADGRTILVIEDDVSFVRILQELIHEHEFQCLVAQTADDGLAMAERHRPSAIVLDLGLPDRSGFTVLDALKHDPATRHIPVHVVSASDSSQTALEMGAAGYSIKPVQREQLAQALKRLEDKLIRKVRRVLVVEANEAQRQSTSKLLEADDVETIGVGSAATALEQLSASTFDCMVLDLTLPDRTGFDLLDEMSQKEQYAFPPVIVYTGRSLSRDEEQRLRRFSSTIIIKGARSPERLLDEVTLFLHQVESELPPDRQRMLQDARNRESVFEGRRILVVEDDVRNIFALSSVLEPRGAVVEIARNGREAVEHLDKKTGVDLVLMDIMMPEMDGLEATRQIRMHADNARLPIIALTAKAMVDDRENCLVAGANDYIAKPFDVDKLLSLLRVWMPR